MKILLKQTDLDNRLILIEASLVIEDEKEGCIAVYTSNGVSGVISHIENKMSMYPGDTKTNTVIRQLFRTNQIEINGVIEWDE